MALESSDFNPKTAKGHAAAEGGHEANFNNTHEPHEGGVHGAFTADLLRNLDKSPVPQQFQPKEEYKNGLASEKLMDLEKWTRDEIMCGKIDQDELTKRIGEFSKKTDDMWDKMEKSNNPEEQDKMAQDESQTYPRFGNIFEQLDEEHRNKALETLPWRLRPGE